MFMALHAHHQRTPEPFFSHSLSLTDFFLHLSLFLILIFHSAQMDRMTNGENSYQQSGGPRNKRRRYRHNGRMKTARDACCLGFLCVCFGIGAILFGTLDPRVDALCNDIGDINREEQRICRPPKTQSVEVRNDWGDLKVYRYAVENLPETHTRTTHWDYNETVWNDEPRHFRFELSAGGTVNFTLVGKQGMVFDVFLMTREQYKEFESKGKTDSVWSNKTAAYSSVTYTAETAGLYYIVSSAPYGTLVVNQRMTITTSVYNVSETTATEVCTRLCTFKDVRHDEVVILDYTGRSKNVVTFVYSGKGGFKDLRLVLIIIIIVSFCSLFFGIMTLINARKAIHLFKKSREQDDDMSSGMISTPDGPPVVP